MAIGVTVFKQQHRTAQPTGLEFANQVVSDEGAAVTDTETFSRSEKLASMRAKIAASSELSMTAPQEPEVVIDETASSTDADGEVVLVAGSLQLCADYQVSTRAWSPRSVTVEEVEGARLVYRETPGAVTASSTEVSEREVLLQLPVRSYPSGGANCISSDVIGIATDGSLIRNSEAGVYGIFGSDTVIGYALDGFPIRGSSAGATDACGGKMGVAGYYYQISSERETIINCFAATPIRF